MASLRRYLGLPAAARLQSAIRTSVAEVEWGPGAGLADWAGVATCRLHLESSSALSATAVVPSGITDPSTIHWRTGIIAAFLIGTSVQGCTFSSLGREGPTFE